MVPSPGISQSPNLQSPTLISSRLLPRPALLDSALADDPPANLATPGLIRPRLRRRFGWVGFDKSRHAKEWIANLETGGAAAVDIKSPRSATTRSSATHDRGHTHAPDKVLAEYIRKQTIANGERFITPDLKGIRDVGAQRRRAPRRDRAAAFAEVCAQVAAHGVKLMQLAQATEVDVSPLGRSLHASLRAPRCGRRPVHRDRRRPPPGGRTDADRRTVRAQ